MKVLIAPDSFKGSMGAEEAARAMAEGLRRVRPDAEILLFPMADGGEGTVEVIAASAGGRLAEAKVAGADLIPVEATYGLLEDRQERWAVLEAAQVVGLPMAGGTLVEERTTLGLGQLLRHCLDLGLRRFLVGLGGSSTNDGGAGLLAALGVGFLDVGGRPVPPTPAGLASLASVDFSGLDRRLAECQIIIMSDVTNPLCGPKGATAIFGPQKGVAPDRVSVLDQYLARLGELCDQWLGRSLFLEAGTGAAGGLGYAFQLLGGEHRSGAEVVLEHVGFDQALSGAGWVLTGEGRSDGQTLQGKVPQAVARHARRAGVPVTLLSGAVDRASLPVLGAAFDGCFALPFGPMSLPEAMRDAPALLADQTEQLARLFLRS